MSKINNRHGEFKYRSCTRFKSAILALVVCGFRTFLWRKFKGVFCCQSHFRLFLNLCQGRNCKCKRLLHPLVSRLLRSNSPQKCPLEIIFRQLSWDHSHGQGRYLGIWSVDRFGREWYFWSIQPREYLFSSLQWSLQFSSEVESATLRYLELYSPQFCLGFGVTFVFQRLWIWYLQVTHLAQKRTFAPHLNVFESGWFKIVR